MTASLQYLGLSCIVLLVLPQVANGLQCYSCTGCDTVSSSTATLSSSTYTACYKIVYQSAGVSVVGRDATTSCTAGSTTYLGFSATMYCCSSDLCNTGVSMSSSFILALAIAAVTGILRATTIN